MQSECSEGVAGVADGAGGADGADGVGNREQVCVAALPTARTTAW